MTTVGALDLVNARTLKVLDEALELPADERNELARELVESLAEEAAPSSLSLRQDGDAPDDMEVTVKVAIQIH